MQVEYLLDDPREAERLAEKVDAGAWVDQYLSSRISEGARVLDVGCGPGVIAAHLARKHPSVLVSAVDISDARVEAARSRMAGLSNASAHVGNALCLPFDEGQFHLVYSRLLLEYIGSRQQVVAEMVRVCAPGGTVLLQDLDGQLVWHYPVDPDLQREIDCVLEGLAGKGFDPFTGRKLFWLAQTAGLVDLSVSATPYHLYPGSVDDKTLRLWELKLDIAVAAVSEILGSRQRAVRLKSRFLQYLSREDTFTYSIVFTVSGRKPR